jgi:hypothetical protein
MVAMEPVIIKYIRLWLDWLKFKKGIFLESVGNMITRLKQS